jgi:DNA-directed RNA polymerase subunit beta'
MADRDPACLPLLEAIAADRPVLLSAGACLSRHGIQAFFAKIVDDEALRLSPMAKLSLLGEREESVVRVFVPCSERAQEDACQRLISPATLRAPEARHPHLALSPDARMGLYLASLGRSGQRGRAVRPGPSERWSALVEGTRIPRRADGSAKGDEARAQLRALVQAQIEVTGALRGFFESLAAVERALGEGELSLHAPIFVRHGEHTLSTVAGRCPVMALLPAELPGALVDRALDQKALEALLEASVERLGAARTARLFEQLEALGLALVTRAGLSLCADDLAIPAQKEALLREGWSLVAGAMEQYEEGIVTGLELHYRMVDIWAFTSDQVGEAMLAPLRRTAAVDPDSGAERLDPPSNPLYQLCESGVAGTTQKLRGLGAMKGLVATRDGEIVDLPITENLREGLSPHAFFLSARASRTAAVDSERRAREDAVLARLLLRALGETKITERDCGALGALPMRSLAGAGELFAGLADRLRGRVHAETGELLVGEALARAAAAEPLAVPVRSTIFCEAEEGVCAACYGLDLATSALPPPGEPVGLHAAHALASQLEHITTRLFHICLCAAAYVGGGTGCDAASLRAASSYVEALVEGTLFLDPASDDALAPLPDGSAVVMIATLSLAVRTGEGVEIACGVPRRGARLVVRPGDLVKRGQTLAESDAFAQPLLAEHTGTLRFVEVTEGETVQTRCDEITGLTRSVIVAPERSGVCPRLTLVSDEGTLLQTLVFDAGDVLVELEGARVSRGATLARRPILSPRMPSAMEGRPDLLRLLHAERQRSSLLSELGGIAAVERRVDRPRTVTIRPLSGSKAQVAEGTRVYTIPPDEYPLVVDGDLVAPGTPLHHGGHDAQEIVRILGPGVGALFLVDQLQLIYSLHGVALDPRHAELVARALLRFVVIVARGDGPWAEGERVERSRFARACAELDARGRTAPSAQLAVTGLGERAGIAARRC